MSDLEVHLVRVTMTAEVAGGKLVIDFGLPAVCIVPAPDGRKYVAVELRPGVHVFYNLDAFLGVPLVAGAVFGGLIQEGKEGPHDAGE